MPVYLGLIVALFLSMLMIPALMRYAGAFGLIDVPDERKHHSGVIPRVGGIAIAAGALAPVLVWAPLEPRVIGFLMAAALIVVFGVLDDRFALNYRVKFLAQLAAVALVIVGGVRFEHLPFFGFESVPLEISVPITAIFLLAVTNAFNLLDGLDGLAAGCAAISLAVLALLAYSIDARLPLTISVLAAGGVFGFLRFNTHPATVFMGDAGSQFLGFTIGVVTILLLQACDTMWTPVIAAFIVGLPVLDTLGVMFVRIRAGRSPFAADRNHVHHRLLQLGFRHHEAVMAIYLVQAGMAGLAYLLRFESDLIASAFYIFVCIAMASAYLVARGSPSLRARIATLSEQAVPRVPFNERARLRLHRWAVAYVEWALAATLIVAAAAARHVSADIGITSMAAALVLALAGAVFGAWRGGIARLAVYFAAITTTFVTSFLMPATWLDQPQIVVFIISLGAAAGAAIYFMPPGQFQVTTLDLLIVLLAVGLLSVPMPGIDTNVLGPALWRVIIALYACEVLMSERPARLGVVGPAAIVSLALLGVSAFFPIES